MPGFAHHLDKRGLATLAGAVNQDDRRIFKRLGEGPLSEARVECLVHHRPTVRFKLVQLKL